MLHTSVSEPDTLSGEVPANVAQLQAAVAALEEQLTGRGIFRRFVTAQTSRGSLSHEACSSASFLSAAAGFLRCVPSPFLPIDPNPYYSPISQRNSAVKGRVPGVSQRSEIPKPKRGRGRPSTPLLSPYAGVFLTHESVLAGGQCQFASLG